MPEIFSIFAVESGEHINIFIVKNEAEKCYFKTKRLLALTKTGGVLG